MKFKLKNYSTSISADKSVMEIESFLINFGASHIMKEYSDGGFVTSLSFRLNSKGYKLPANLEGVEKIIYEGKRLNSRSGSREKRLEQCNKITWRIIRDWIHAQLSLIFSGQAQPDQVLLPYMFNGKKTVYELYKDGTLQLEDNRES